MLIWPMACCYHVPRLVSSYKNKMAAEHLYSWARGLFHRLEMQFSPLRSEQQQALQKELSLPLKVFVLERDLQGLLWRFAC